LGGYFQAANVFLCLSEHEGFCVPLLEAMAFDVPVVAYHSTGVPHAMGGAGLLVRDKRYDLLAELIDLIAEDSEMRGKVVAAQRRRLKELAPEKVAAVLRASAASLAAS
jgi:glycosyltransferase involved in cell wall biosynthesis